MVPSDWEIRSVKGSLTALPLMLLGIVASCGPRPEEVVREAIASVAKPASDTLERALDPTYIDALGDRSAVLAHVAEWRAAHGQRTVEIRELDVEEGISRATAHAYVDALLEFRGGPASVRAEGRVRLELVRNGRFRIRGGFLTELRDTLELVRARREALEANDFEGLEALIHPNYGGHPAERESLLEGLRENLKGQVVRMEPRAYRIEVRPQLLHVDEHYRLRVGGRSLRPTVARLTLARSAGRLKILAGLQE